MSDAVPLIAVVQPGIEKLVARQIRALGGGIGHTSGRNGRVTFDGPDDAVYRANLELRTAERILMPLAIDEVVPNFRVLRRIVSELPWEEFVPAGLEVRCHVSARGCRLYHTDAVADALREGIRMRGMKLPRGDGRTWVTVDARGTKDRWTISLDTSGPALSRRGYRKATAKAPLRETLAAAVLALAGWDGTTPLLDPACGAGTLAIEAAMLAQGRAPGLDRGFGFERWPCFDPDRWDELKDAARARVVASPGVAIEAADAAGGAVKAARANSSRAGTKHAFRLVQREVLETSPADGPGLIVVNPPYGKRTTPAPLDRWADHLAAVRPGWDLVAVGPPEVGRRLGCDPKPLAKITVGGIKAGVWRRPAPQSSDGIS